MPHVGQFYSERPVAKLVSVVTENNYFQHVEVISRNREKRGRYGKFFVEGVSSINLAIANGWQFDSLIFEKGRALSDWAQHILKSVPAELHIELAPSLMAKLSEREETSELLALVKMRSLKLEDLPLRQNGLYVLFDRPSSPGNLGTSIRSADAFGADGVIISGHAVDLYEPRVLRSSIGTVFARPVVAVESPRLVVEWLESAKEQGVPFQVIGTSARSDTTLAECVVDQRPILLLMGNETSGLSRAYKEMVDTLVSIPLKGSASSLNVSSALSIVLYELSQKGAAQRGG